MVSPVGLLHAYWAMCGERLPVPLDDLVRRETVVSNPTNFAAMSSRDLQDITTRGEQLTRVLLAHYLRDLC
jgi:NTE family protein